MPTERRKRRDEQKRQEQSKAGLVRKVIIAVLIVGAFGGAYRLGRRKRTSRLDAFAQCVAEKQAKMYGLYWCTHCAEQKEMFGSSFQYIPYVECGIRGSRGEEAKAETRAMLLVAALAGLGFALYLTYIEAFALVVWCVLCLTSLTLILAITVLSAIVVADSARKA